MTSLPDTVSTGPPSSDTSPAEDSPPPDDGWSDQELKTAADLYAAGESLATIGQHFGIDPATVANRFRRAGAAHQSPPRVDLSLTP